MGRLLAGLVIGATLAGDPLSARAAGVRFGVQTTNQDATWDEIRAAWKLAEELGFHSAWVFDHFLPIFGSEEGATLEGWTLLAALAAETERIRLGVMVTGNTYRNPALLAKMATTLDHVSDGRLILGLGAGWFARDHSAFGFHSGTDRARAERLAEALQVITKLWGEDHPSFQGKYYSLDRAPFAPGNVQSPHPPIVIGGQGKKWIVPLVGRYADGWNAVTGVTPDGVRERIEIIQDECARVGRDPCPSDVSILLPLVTITRIPLAGPLVRFGARAVVDKRIAGAILAGSPTAIEERIRSYVDAGVNEIILSVRAPFDADLLRAFASDVMPRFRTATGD
jgi:F420-dependent oxidoreductase-like protein